MTENAKETEKKDIKKKRKSLTQKKKLIDLEEAQNKKNTKESFNTIKKSIVSDSITHLKLKDNVEEYEENIKKDNIKPIKRKVRRSVMFQPMITLNGFDKLKDQLTNVSELIVHQEADISEAICNCQQPNNYHIYLREKNGKLSYIFKLREYSGDCNRIFCPVNCREFSMKLKLVLDTSNKYDDDFGDSLMTMQRDWKMPCLCCCRPELVIELIKEKTMVGKVEQSFAFFDPVFRVYNEKEEEIYYIEADCCQCGYLCRNNSLGKTDDCQFLIYNSNDREKPIGYIMKKTESVYSLADSYFVVFPPYIQSEHKFLLSIVAVLIDYQYYEKNNDVK